MPIKGTVGYVVVVTSQTPEPTLADLLAAMTEQRAALAALATLVEQGFGHVMTELAGVKADVAASEDRLRGEIQATEADLASRIGAVQDVLRTVKADIAAHVDSPANHHRHAA